MILNDEEFAAYLDARYAEMSPELLERCRVVFDENLKSDMATLLESHWRYKGVHWFDTGHGHHGYGTFVRNLLRKAGIYDSELPQGNWDDYYVQAIENWLGIRK